MGSSSQTQNTSQNSDTQNWSNVLGSSSNTTLQNALQALQGFTQQTGTNTSAGSTAQTGRTAETTSSTVSPWGPQGSAIEAAIANAQNAYGKASSVAAPTDFTAGMTPEQLSTFKSMVGYGPQVLPSATNLSNTGTNLVSSGAAGATGALDRLGAFDPATYNNMGANIAGAKSYADNLDIPGAVKAALRDATQQARDVTLPGMESAAAGNGNINSSRTALAEGLVQRGLAEKAADLSSTMRNSALETGANLTSNTNTNNTNAMLSALVSRLSGGTNLTSTGAGVTGSGADVAGKLFDIANTGGAGLQNATQLDLTNQAQRYQSGVSSPYDALRGLMDIIGQRSWGQNTTGTNTGVNNVTGSTNTLDTSNLTGANSSLGFNGTSGYNTGNTSLNTNERSIGRSTGTSNTTSTPSALQTIGGLAYGLGNLFMLSDRRLKTEIARIGQTDDGIPIYRYRYIGRKRFEIGFLASEVEKINRDAVNTVAGIKFVDYGEATKHLV